MNNRSSVFGWIALFEAIGGLILGIVTLKLFDSWGAAILVWAIYIDFVLLFYALYVHFSNQESQISTSEMILEELKKCNFETGKQQQKSSPSYVASNTARPNHHPAASNNPTWVCRKCGTTNAISSRMCKDCGTYR